MNAFNSPLGSIAFEYLNRDVSAILVSNIWTCLAVLCAGAASFLWRPKPPVTLPHAHIASSCNISSTCVHSEHNDQEEYPMMIKSETTRIIKDDNIINDDCKSCDGVTKGKFVAYFYEEGGESLCDDDGEECEFFNGDGHAEVLGGCFSVEKMERVVEMKEMGWYRCQDLTVFNGDVVRLWDGGLM